MLSAIAAIIFFSLVIVGCKKEENSRLDTNSLTKEISSSSEFREPLLNLSEIKRAIKSTSNLLQEKPIQEDLFKEAATIESLHTLNSFLLKLGYSNAEARIKHLTYSP